MKKNEFWAVKQKDFPIYRYVDKDQNKMHIYCDTLTKVSSLHFEVVKVYLREIKEAKEKRK